MQIESIELRYFHYNSFSTDANDGLVHIKSLPYLSVVQSKVGSYGIELHNDSAHLTGDGNFFIAPSLVTQKITHHSNKELNLFTGRYLFLDIIINKKYSFDDIFDTPVIPGIDSSNTFNSMFDEYEASEDICDKMRCLYGIVKHLISISEEKSVFRNAEIFPLIEFIKGNYTKNITVSQMAEILKMSESNLYAVFKKNTGVSPVRYVNDYRLSVASNLLSETKDSIKSIAEKVGINDEFYFSKLFKAKYSISPQKYRKSLK